MFLYFFLIRSQPTLKALKISAVTLTVALAGLLGYAVAISGSNSSPDTQESSLGAEEAEKSDSKFGPSFETTAFSLSYPEGWDTFEDSAAEFVAEKMFGDERAMQLIVSRMDGELSDADLVVGQTLTYDDLDVLDFVELDGITSLQTYGIREDGTHDVVFSAPYEGYTYLLVISSRYEPINSADRYEIIDPLLASWQWK